MFKKRREEKRRKRRRKKVVENYGHISRCDNIGVCVCVRLQCICAFEKIFNDNRTHTHTSKRKGEKRKKEVGRSTIVQYRAWLCMPKVACMHCPLFENEMYE